MPRNEIVDEEYDGVDITTSRKPKTKDEDDNLFDDLPNGLKTRGAVRDEEDEVVDHDDDQDQDDDLDDDQDDQDDEDELVRRREERGEQRRSDKDPLAKRLARERRLKDEARDEADALRSQFDNLNREFANLKSAVETTLSTTEIDAKQKELNDTVSRLKVQLKAAKEAGDTDLELEITDKLIDAKSEIKTLDTKRADAKKAATAAAEAAKLKPVQSRHTVKWLRTHNKEYNTDRVFRAAADAVDKEVAGERYDPNTEEYWRQVDRRLAKKFPEYFPHLKRDGKTRRRQPVESEGDDMPTQRSDRQRAEPGTIRVRNGKAYLSPLNIKTMRSVGLDPNDPADVKAFVRENT